MASISTVDKVSQGHRYTDTGNSLYYNHTVKKISYQIPARTRTAAHFTVIAGFQYEGL